MITPTNQGDQNSQIQDTGVKNLRQFSIFLLILQLILIPIYAIFLRVEPHNDPSSIGYSYPSYMDLILIMTIGTCCLNTFIRTYSYTGMIHTWIFYVVSIQIFFLFSAMWRRIILDETLFDRGNLEGKQWKIWIRQQDFTLAAYSCTVMNIVFGILLGRIGFFEKFIIVIIQMFAYTLNALILNDLLKVYDVGGSLFCHTFGAYFGMGVSYVLSKNRRPITKIQNNYETVIFSYLGCFLIFCFSPSINSQYLTQTPFQKSVVIMNTILAMCASVMVSFALSVFIKGKFSVIDLFNGSLSGCIGAGSSTGLFVNPAGCMILGAISGITCVLGMEYLTGWIERKWKIFDTFGIHNVRGIPGIIGGIGGAIAISVSHTIEKQALNQLPFLLNPEGKSISKMAGFQIVGTLSTVIFSLITGMLTGWIVKFVNKIQAKEFYKDNVYFEVPQDFRESLKKQIIDTSKENSLIDSNILEFNQKNNNQISHAQQGQTNSKIKFQDFKKFTHIQPTITFQQKINTKIKNLENPPIKERNDEHSQFSQKIKKGKQQLQKQNQNMQKID